MTFSPGTHLGPYEILTSAGTGGMARCTGRATRRSGDVAIKLLVVDVSTNPLSP